MSAVNALPPRRAGPPRDYISYSAEHVRKLSLEVLLSSCRRSAGGGRVRQSGFWKFSARSR